eukprot:gene18075-biopygen12940
MVVLFHQLHGGPVPPTAWWSCSTNCMVVLFHHLHGGPVPPTAWWSCSTNCSACGATVAVSCFNQIPRKTGFGCQGLWVSFLCPHPSPPRKRGGAEEGEGARCLVSCVAPNVAHPQTDTLRRDVAGLPPGGRAGLQEKCNTSSFFFAFGGGRVLFLVLRRR